MQMTIKEHSIMSDRDCNPADHPKMKPLTQSVLILAAFVLFFVAWYFSLGIRPVKAILGDSQTVHYLLNYISAGIIPMAALWLLHRPWIVFGVSTNGALGGIAANVLRFGTIVIAIGLTIVYKKQRGLPYFINTKTLVFKHA